MAYREPKTLEEIVSFALNGKRVSWRAYGMHGERRRPMIHRFPVKGGDTVAEVMKENLTRTCALLETLARKSR